MVVIMAADMEVVEVMVAVGETVDMVVMVGPATREEAVVRMEEAGGIRIRFFSG